MVPITLCSCWSSLLGNAHSSAKTARQERNNSLTDSPTAPHLCPATPPTLYHHIPSKRTERRAPVHTRSLNEGVQAGYRRLRKWMVWCNFSAPAEPERPVCRQEPFYGAGEGDASLSSVSDSGAAMRREVNLLG
ncbi:unnamed protein product [Pleuronectes platessa]|uniref:Uncharacterized protein n=1 Tax=Pleuronectes platessa TaxID=8262 RepID=A0A9N7UUQ4_PLEPL|nr:unnamed protein product [Pleuronectes platessa]